ncbi:Aste57867_22396 [Aphanomyces stellatus]|uniref:Aste57867_22396 protein n=1 Tax=Aphanomyces stellatus TaxID=120398 RepID=A0A485LKQ7_9STRA|nr:hypothetical protein As57867_022326 [Aphanomyces stellatus]VFT99059.1 Aste57867_22396 [Aphanomyces stellatus]
MGPNDVFFNLRKTLASPALFASHVRKLIKTKDLANLDPVLQIVRDADDSDALLLLWQFLLENTFPNYPERRAEDTALQACLIHVLERPELKANTSRKVESLTTHTLQLVAHLNAHPNKLADLDLRRDESQFCARVLAYAYLRQDLVRQQVVSKVAQVTRHREWFKKPVSAAGAFPHWVSSLLPVTVQSTDVTTFEQALLQWLTLEPASLYDEKALAFQSPEEASLFDTLVESGEFYFTFVVCLMQWREADALTNDQWKLAVPHYDSLITVALRLLHESAYKRQFYDFSAPKHPTLMLTRANQDAVLTLSGHLLKNSDLVHICILALFESTNLANAKSVGVCLDRLASWFDMPGIDWLKSIKPSPAEFNWTVAVRLLLHCEQADVVIRTLHFLYKIMGVIPWELRHRLLRTLAQRHFALFLHWHRDVRLFYHHVLVYKICPHVHRALLDSATDILLVRNPDLHHIVHGDDHASGGSPARGHGAILAREMQVWKNFDGFISLVCFQERVRAIQANKIHRHEVELAQTRVHQLMNLHPVSDEITRVSWDASSDLDVRPSSAIESLMDMESVMALERLSLSRLLRAPPYLRHIPDEEVMHMEAVVRAACPGDADSFYPKELQVYAAKSLICYSAVLQKYYDACTDDENGLVLTQLPPLPTLGHD